MKHSPASPPAPSSGPRLLRRLAGLLALTGLVATAQTPSVVTSHDSYVIGEDINIAFSGGPGNPKDWVGVYPVDAEPGPVPSTIWNYVNGTQTSTVGLTEGSLAFPGGLNFAGPWKAYFLLNDGYTILAETAFQVVDEGTPLVRVNQRTYETGQAITITFSSGPNNAKDWIGLYKAGQTPGDVNSTQYLYVDGTQAGNTGLSEGAVTFSSGLAEAGNYVAFFLQDDGYNVLASETFTVLAPSANKPRLLSVNPADGATGVSPVVVFDASITNGATTVVTSSLVLKLDGQAVTPVIAEANGLVTVRYTNSSLSLPLSVHTYELSYLDNATPPAQFVVSGTFTIAAYENIVLPAPIVFENFDSTPEGQVPAGWTLKSYTEALNTDLDLGNLDSASFANWTVVAVDRFLSPFVTYSNPETTTLDYQRVLTANPLNVLNGQVVSGPLASGRMLFGDSGYRNGRSQVVYVFTPDFDLTGQTNIHVVFHSLYEQNQDSIGALEYSVDTGANWLPVAYLLDGPDILRTETGDMDVDATFNTPGASDHERIAEYTDENGAELGGTYGAFIAAPISPALAPFIQARVDDNPVESKRIEKYRLPLADNAKTVRLRFAYAGTDSWYWGVDNFGLYSIGAVTPTPPTLSAEVTSTGLRLSWPAGTAGYVLQGSPSLTQPAWTGVDGVTGNSVVVPFTGDARYFRLTSP